MLLSLFGMYISRICAFGTELHGWCALLDQVVRMVVGKTDAGHLYSRVIPLVLLLVDGNALVCLGCCNL